MTENTPPVVDDLEAGLGGAGESAEEATNQRSATTAWANPDSGHVPDKQIGRWKDDGGAVDFSG
jgi:hypothetical protein